MPTTTTFTTRIDTELKARLEQVAQYEDRSASYLANQAIRALVEEREATHALVATGLELAQQGHGQDEAAIDAWLSGPADAPYPTGSKSR